jgi:hypothetical protein
MAHKTIALVSAAALCFLAFFLGFALFFHVSSGYSMVSYFPVTGIIATLAVAGFMVAYRRTELPGRRFVINIAVPILMLLIPIIIMGITVLGAFLLFPAFTRVGISLGCGLSVSWIFIVTGFNNRAKNRYPTVESKA